MPKLEDMIGQMIIAVIPIFHPACHFKLHGVESGGLWLESQEAIETLLKMFEAPAAPKTPVFFVPFHQITFVAVFVDSVSLSETSLGVKD